MNDFAKLGFASSVLSNFNVTIKSLEYQDHHHILTSTKRSKAIYNNRKLPQTRYNHLLGVYYRRSLHRSTWLHPMVISATAIAIRRTRSQNHYYDNQRYLALLLALKLLPTPLTATRPRSRLRQSPAPASQSTARQQQEAPK